MRHFLKRHVSFLQVGMVGVVGAGIQALLLIFLVESAHLYPVFANILAGEAAIISNFTLNNAWTFKGNSMHALPKRFVMFNASALGSIAIQAVVVWLGVSLLGHSLYLLYAAAGIGAGLIFNYLLYTNFVWRSPSSRAGAREIYPLFCFLPHMKDTAFYNQESSQYSSRRYPKVAGAYTQFFFKRRLAITKSFISNNLGKIGESPALLEMGCADGIIIREIESAFPDKFKKLIGIDIAPQMIAEAKNKNENPRAEFFTRDQYLLEEPVDLIVETGVVNYANFNEELAFARLVLKQGGLYLLSVAGTGSFLNMLKPQGGFNDFRSYKEYDQLLQEKFIVQSVRGCGFFIPYLWRMPAVARIVQSLIDPLAGFIFPGLCHEKVYLLEKK